MADILQERYEISPDPARLDPDRIHHWLSTDAYWALGRTREMQGAWCPQGRGPCPGGRDARPRDSVGRGGSG